MRYFAPLRLGEQPAARQCPWPDAENAFGGEVSSQPSQHNESRRLAWCCQFRESPSGGHAADWGAPTCATAVSASGGLNVSGIVATCLHDAFRFCMSFKASTYPRT